MRRKQHAACSHSRSSISGVRAALVTGVVNHVVLLGVSSNGGACLWINHAKTAPEELLLWASRFASDVQGTGTSDLQRRCGGNSTITPAPGSSSSAGPRSPQYTAALGDGNCSAARTVE